MQQKQKKKKWITYKGYKCKAVAGWQAPDDMSGAVLLTMPNIPHPLHTLNPRNIVGPTMWRKMRERAYKDADYTCEICGVKVATEYEEDGSVKNQYHDDGTLPKRQLHGHEVYNIDYDMGTAEFVKVFALCKKCHVDFIHSGRMLTMYKQGDPLTSAEVVLEGIEHGFRLIKQYNDEHYGEENLRAFYALIDFIDDEVIGDRVKELIEKYDIEFYIPYGAKFKKDVPKWEGWKLIYNGHQYYSPFHSREDWEKAMTEQNKKQLENRKSYIARFKKFDTLDSTELSDTDMKKIQEAKIPDDF